MLLSTVRAASVFGTFRTQQLVLHRTDIQECPARRYFRRDTAIGAATAPPREGLEGLEGGRIVEHILEHGRLTYFHRHCGEAVQKHGDRKLSVEHRSGRIESNVN